MVKVQFDFCVKCRACLSEDEEMHYLYGEFDQGLTLSDILKITTNFEIEEQDGFSPYLCENCTTVVVNFFNFRTLYQENEVHIRSLLEEGNSKNRLLDTVIVSDDTDNTEIKKTIDQNQTEVEERYEKNIMVIAEVFNSCSLDIGQNSKFEITGGFVDPQEIEEENRYGKEKLNNCKEENIIITPSSAYSCDQCEDCFLSKTILQQHLLLNHRRPVLESNCTLKHTNKSQSDTKLDKNDSVTCSKIISQSKKYICEHCGAAFKKRSYLEDHAEVHTTEKRHVCSMCGKAFRRRTVLVKHKRLHTHPRQCVCEVCGLRFNDKGTLKTHIKLKHTKEKNFLCTLCGQWFSLKSTLDKHIFRHSESKERPFQCSICGQAYKDKSSLKRHMIVKHTDNAKRPACIYCRKKYTTNTNLLKHIRRHHKSVIKQDVECK